VKAVGGGIHIIGAPHFFLNRGPARSGGGQHLGVAQLGWLQAQVKACSRETHSPSRASKTYGHNAFQIIHYTLLLSTVVAHTLLNTAHTVGSDCGYNPG